MKRFIVVVAVCLSVVLLSTGWAECPVGKTEIKMTTQSGKTHLICVPDTAASGLEHASGGSGITISGTCPCFEEAELQKITDYERLGCESGGTGVGTLDDGITYHYALTYVLSSPLDARVFDLEPVSSNWGPDGYVDYCAVSRFGATTESIWVRDKLDKMRCTDLLKMYCNTGPR